MKIHKTSSPAKVKEKDVIDTTLNSTDLYRMCKKIAQLTKVSTYLKTSMAVLFDLPMSIQ